ncbi:MAG: hypothetical protein R3Y09_08205 [Clostridia bacterium]
MTNHHNHDCCCNHGHDHNHGEQGCCGQHKPVKNEANLTQNERDFLHHLSHIKYLPLASFVTKSTKESSFAIIALQPVFIRSVADTMDDIRECGEFLLGLEQKGFITLDYDIPLDGYAYDEYKNSELFVRYSEVVAEGAKQENFLGDIPTIEFGSIAIVED